MIYELPKKINSFLKNNKDQFLIALSVFIIVLSSHRLYPGSGSNGNVEQWINLTNQMFYGKQDFLFSYGPLFWMAGGATAQYNNYTYWLTVIFLSVLYASYWSVILTLIRKADAYVFLAIAYFLFFSQLDFPAALFLWPFAIVAYIEFAKPSPSLLPKNSLIIIGFLVGVSFYIRFFYGIIGLVTFGSYLFSRFLTQRKISEPIFLAVGLVFGYLVAGFLIFHDKASLFNYFLINSQLNFGNSVDMTLDVPSNINTFIAAGVVLVSLNTYLILQRRSLFISVNLLALIFLKIGFGRTDHYIGYFVIPAAALALVMVFDRSKLGRVLFVIVMGGLYYVSVNPVYPGAPTKNALRPPADFKVDYATRMQNAYEEKFKLGESMLNVIGGSTIDVYPYNNEYVFANKLNYWHRPLFQNYMTLTPTLDAMNKKFFESPGRPKFVLWTAGIGCRSSNCNTFDDFDQKYSLNEDPLTTSSILLNYHLVSISKNRAGGTDAPILLLQENDQYITYSTTILSEQVMQFGKWYKVPRAIGGVTKIAPDFNFTDYGRLKNVLFRGSIIKINYKTVSGEIGQYRLNALNAKSGIWVSPLLDGFQLSGPAVDSIMFESKSPNYVERSFKSKWVNVSIPNINTKKTVFDPVLDIHSRSEVQVSCDGSIDSANGISPVPLRIDATGVLKIHGWLASSTKNGKLFDRTFLTVTDSEGRRVFFSTHGEDRKDVAQVFKHQSLSAAGYEALIDVSSLNGIYKLGLAGIYNSELHQCSQFAIPLAVSQ